jgi:glycosyltransferase involved in cell wall biosynthesis
MAAGLPVVVTDVVGLHNVIKHGTTGFPIKLGNISESVLA